MKYAILASGSRGNATIIKSGDHLLMIDCGIPKKELWHKLNELGVDINDIEAVLITHEHIDHIRSIEQFALSKLYGCENTYKFEGKNTLIPYSQYIIAGVKVMPVAISHDCANPCGYVISDEKETLVYVTDTGYIKEKDYQYIANATHYIFESNYDSAMLMECPTRPFYLKQRIMSMQGHLSNDDAANTLTQLVGDRTRTIRLAHVSEDCNSKTLAYHSLIAAFNECGISYSEIDIEVADRYEITKGEIKK